MNNLLQVPETLPVLSISSVSVSEGSAFAVVVASLSNPSTQSITFYPYLRDASATASTENNTGDFLPSTLEYFDSSSGEFGAWLQLDPNAGVTFAVGQVEVLLRISLANDNIFEGREEFYVYSGPIDGGIDVASNLDSVQPFGTIQICDDGSNPNAFLVDGNSYLPTQDLLGPDDDRPILTISSVELSEGSPYAVVVASLSNPSVQPITFYPYVTADSATPTIEDVPGDFLPASLEFFDPSAGDLGAWLSVDPNLGVTLNAGQIEVMLRAALVNDSLFERKEEFYIRSGEIVGAYASLYPQGLKESYGTVAIFDDGSNSSVYLDETNSDSPALFDVSPDDDTPSLFFSSVDVSDVSPYALFVAYLGNPSTNPITFYPSLASSSSATGVFDDDPLDIQSGLLQYYCSNVAGSSSWIPVDPIAGITFEPGLLEILLRVDLRSSFLPAAFEQLSVSIDKASVAVNSPLAQEVSTITLHSFGLNVPVFLRDDYTDQPRLSISYPTYFDDYSFDVSRLFDSPILSSDLNAIDCLTSGLVRVAPFATLIGSLSNVITAFESPGIVDMESQSVVLTDVAAVKASDLNKLDGLTNGLVDGGSLVGIIGLRDEIMLAYSSSGIFNLGKLGSKSFIVTDFDATSYLASNPDLITAFGLDTSAASSHYNSTGFSEGRVIDAFDEIGYLTRYADLRAAYGGSNLAAATYHYIVSGYREGRSSTSFSAISYLASNPDLIIAFSANDSAAAIHYASAGFREGRQIDSFDELNYLAANSDLIRAYGADGYKATQHYVSSGFFEGRLTGGFDSASYLASNPDLVAVFGANKDLATLHYVMTGFSEGRHL